VSASQERKTPVVVTLGQTGDALRLTVRDNGVGIAPELLERIFEPGFTTRAFGSGSGTGLTVVRQITEEMFGGTVEVDSAVRRGGWTVRQVVHHVPDSHLNAYTRFKLACTEDSPTIKTYEEARWAELPEARTAPIDVSLDLLTALHRRWVLFLRLLGPDDFARTVRHPEWGSP